MGQDEQATWTGSMHICISPELVHFAPAQLADPIIFTFFLAGGVQLCFWKGPACVRMHGIRYHSFFTPPYMTAVSDRHNIVQ